MQTRTRYNINWLTESFESGDALKFIYFWGHSDKNKEQIGKFCFSQWFESTFTVGNVTYKTAEHWMMAHKALLFEDYKTYEKIIRCEKPGEAKELGREVLYYDDNLWNERKFDIVKLGNIHKFNQHPPLADYLLQTGNRVLVEASPVDTIWGIGLSQDSEYIDNIYAWRGQNLLGFVLMEVRDFLKGFGRFSDLEHAIQARWLKFPNLDSYDMFWRTGKGDEYLFTFHQFYSKLTEREQKIYQLTNPPPHNWRQFYAE